MTLSFSLLGHLRVTVDGKPARFATDYVRALLAYLVVEAQPEGRVYPRTTLAALLWPEQPEPVARHNLRQALLHLRQALRDFEELPRCPRDQRKNASIQREDSCSRCTPFSAACSCLCGPFTHDPYPMSNLHPAPPTGRRSLSG